MALEVITTGGGNATADSIVIPQTDLAAYGVTGAEMTNDAIGIARSVFGFMKAVQAFDMSALIGITKPASPSLSVVAGNYMNRTYQLTISKYVDLTTGLNGVLPLPTIGTNNGVGGFALVDIFPNAVKVAAAGAVAAEALLFPSVDLTAIDSSILHAGIDITAGQDNRDILSAMYEAMADVLDLRDDSTASAFIALSRGTLGLTPTVPATFIDETNPTTGLVRQNALDGQIGLLTKSHSITLQTEEDNANETFDVRVATS